MAGRWARVAELIPNFQEWNLCHNKLGKANFSGLKSSPQEQDSWVLTATVRNIHMIYMIILYMYSLSQRQIRKV